MTSRVRTGLTLIQSALRRPGRYRDLRRLATTPSSPCVADSSSAASPSVSAGGTSQNGSPMSSESSSPRRSSYVASSNHFPSKRRTSKSRTETGTAVIRCRSWRGSRTCIRRCSRPNDGAPCSSSVTISPSSTAGSRNPGASARPISSGYPPETSWLFRDQSRQTPSSTSAMTRMPSHFSSYDQVAPEGISPNAAIIGSTGGPLAALMEPSCRLQPLQGAEHLLPVGGRPHRRQRGAQESAVPLGDDAGVEDRDHTAVGAAADQPAGALGQ